MSEDRHSFSEPRPVPNLELPTWDVDVYRDGVEEAILTLRIDSNSLPPRKNKKKKVVWKLPDSFDVIPRFGVEERKRLMEIFKTAKKERRKSKRTSTETSTATTAMMDGTSQHQKIQLSQDDHTTTNSNNSNNNNNNNIDLDHFHPEEKKDGNINHYEEQERAASSFLDNHHHRSKTKAYEPQSTTTATTATTTTTTTTTANSLAAAPPTLNPQGLQSSMQAMSIVQDENISEMKRAQVPDLKDGTVVNLHDSFQRTNNFGSMETSSSSLQPPRRLSGPPPGLAGMTRTTSTTTTRAAAAIATPTSPTTLPPSSLDHPPTPLDSVGQPALASPATTTPPRFFYFPQVMDNTTNMALLQQEVQLAAHHVMETYYALLNQSRIEELILYYSPTAMKSLSLKSAHAKCHNRTEMVVQFQSLIACSFSVQGILTQRVDMSTILLVWSGICQMHNVDETHSFCHNFVLKRKSILPCNIRNPATTTPSYPQQQYQIENDALVLLTND